MKDISYMADLDLIVLDIDGCIKPANRKKTNIDGLQFLQNYCEDVEDEDGRPPIILLTGRPAPYCESVIQDIGAFGDEFEFSSVCENGAIFWDHNSASVSDYHPIVHEKSDAIGQLDQLATEICSNYNAVKELGKEVCVSLNPTEGSVEELYNTVLDITDDRNISNDFNIDHSATAVDITPAGINKKTGLQNLLNKNKIDPSNVLGVGDSRSDFNWLNHIGYPATPSNGVTELKEMPGVFVADEDDALGVRQIITEHV